MQVTVEDIKNAMACAERHAITEVRADAFVDDCYKHGVDVKTKRPLPNGVIMVGEDCVRVPVQVQCYLPSSTSRDLLRFAGYNVEKGSKVSYK